MTQTKPQSIKMNPGKQWTLEQKKVSIGKKMMKADEEETTNEKKKVNLVIYGCWCKKWIQIFMIYLSLMSKVCFFISKHLLLVVID